MDNAAIEEMFEAVGPVTIRRMFGGKGIYARGIIFALELRGDLMLAAGVQDCQHVGRAGPHRLIGVAHVGDGAAHLDVEGLAGGRRPDLGADLLDRDHELLPELSSSAAFLAENSSKISATFF